MSGEEVITMTMGLMNTHMQSQMKQMKDKVKQQTKDMTMFLRDAEMLSQRLDRYTDYRRETQ